MVDSPEWVNLCFVEEEEVEAESDAESDIPQGYTDENQAWLKPAGKRKKMMVCIQ